MKVLTLLLIVLACSVSRSQQLQHDISVDSIISPRGYVPLGFPNQIRVRYTNRGTSDETNVPTYFRGYDQYHQVVYLDTIYIPLIKSGQTIDRSYSPITMVWSMQVTFCAVSLLSTDQNRSNDQSCDAAVVRFQKDFTAVSMQYPKPTDSIEYRTPFNAIAAFQNHGTVGAFLRTRLEIRNISSHQLVFQVDTSLADSVRVDSSVSIVFPDHQNTYDTRTIPPGTYILAALSRSLGDGDLSNDTIFSVIKIYAQHDIGIDSIVGLSDTLTIASSSPLFVRITNNGNHFESALSVGFRVIYNGQTVQCDTIAVTNMSRGERRDVRLMTFWPIETGTYQLCAYTIFSSDQDSTNNSSCASTVVFHKHDLQAPDLREYSLLDIHMGDTLPMIATFTNNGLANELNARFACTIALNNTLIYSDTVIAPIKRFGSAQVQFKPYVIATLHPVMICVTSLLASDEDHSNDEGCVLGQNTDYANLKALAVDWPRKDDSVTIPFAPVARFMNAGYGTIFNAMFSVEINGIDDPSQHRTIPGGIGNFPGSSTARSYTFDSNATYYLTPGRYRIAAIARAGDDMPSDDTAYSTFSIVGSASRVDAQSVSALNARIAADGARGNVLALSLTEQAHVSFGVFDMTGKKVAMKDLGNLHVGDVRVPLDVNNLASGRYEVVVRAGEHTTTVPFVVLH